jgi:hypothetical protein
MKNLLLTVVIAHATTTIAMFGVIWFVQIVHYPLFRDVGEPGFAEYEKRHSRTTAVVVMPLMLVEAACAVGLTVLLTDQPLVWLGLGLLVIVWLSTFLLQVPQHRALAGGFDIDRHRRLVRTNWVRTIAWTGRAAVALSLLAVAIRGL